MKLGISERRVRLLLQKGGKQRKWLPLVDLFRNYKLEIQFTLADLKRLSEMFGLPKIVYVPTGK